MQRAGCGSSRQGAVPGARRGAARSPQGRAFRARARVAGGPGAEEDTSVHNSAVKIRWRACRRRPRRASAVRVAAARAGAPGRAEAPAQWPPRPARMRVRARRPAKRSGQARGTFRARLSGATFWVGMVQVTVCIEGQQQCGGAAARGAGPPAHWGGAQSSGAAGPGPRAAARQARLRPAANSLHTWGAGKPAFLGGSCALGARGPGAWCWVALWREQRQLPKRRPGARGARASQLRPRPPGAGSAGPRWGGGMKWREGGMQQRAHGGGGRHGPPPPGAR